VAITRDDRVDYGAVNFKKLGLLAKAAGSFLRQADPARVRRFAALKERERPGWLGQSLPGQDFDVSVQDILGLGAEARMNAPDRRRDWESKESPDLGHSTPFSPTFGHRWGIS
jgi:hypothetical protein